MRFQETEYSCGAAAVLNAARCFGKRIPERIARSIAETTPDGTDDSGIIKALNILGLEGTAFEYPFFDNAMEEVRDNLNYFQGNPTIICIQNLQHWVVVVGGTDSYDRYIVVDSARTKKNMKENGVQVLSEKELRKLWQTRKSGCGFFGITIRRPKRKKKK